MCVSFMYACILFNVCASKIQHMVLSVFAFCIYDINAIKDVIYVYIRIFNRELSIFHLSVHQTL